MAKISRDEVLKIANISAIAIHEQEIKELQEQLEHVLTYAERVIEISSDAHAYSRKNTNVFRDDLVLYFNAELILAQAPERSDNFFVVPMIIEHN